MKRVILVHRWYGSPEADWYPWLKQELESKEITVLVPAMPTPDAPEIKTWNSALAKAVGKPDMDTYLIGHSVGCQTILRYLEQAAATARVGGCVFVAGWFSLTSEAMPTENEQTIAQPWLANVPDLSRAKKHCTSFVTFLSDNDPYISVEQNKNAFEKLGTVIMEHNKGHYDEDSNCKQVPQVLQKIQELLK